LEEGLDFEHKGADFVGWDQIELMVVPTGESIKRIFHCVFSIGDVASRNLQVP